MGIISNKKRHRIWTYIFHFFVFFLCFLCVFCVLEDSRELNRNSHLALAQFIAVPTRLLDSLPEEVAPPQSLQDRTGIFLRWGNVVRETREQLRWCEALDLRDHRRRRGTTRTTIVTHQTTGSALPRTRRLRGGRRVADSRVVLRDLAGPPVVPQDTTVPTSLQRSDGQRDLGGAWGRTDKLGDGWHLVCNDRSWEFRQVLRVCKFTRKSVSCCIVLYVC